tara:strand:- start:291 stop:551 length:261 start_codon:yes stop_codon:yes gene_type:complete
MAFRELREIVLLAGISGIISYGLHDAREDVRRIDEVSIVADANGDGVTTHLEWARVYQRFGLHYDLRYSDPKEDLSDGNLNAFLSN